MKHKIYACIEKDDKIRGLLNQRTNISDWKLFTRTHFNIIAKEINNKVSAKVLENPVLISDYLLIGKDKIENISIDFDCDGIEDVIDYLDLDSNTTFNWISGKTLERYWKVEQVNPKDLKMNVLLTYLDVPIKDWDDWKYYSQPIVEDVKIAEVPTVAPDSKQREKSSIFFSNLKNYYLGSYYLYYLKTNNSNRVVKTPFVIKLDTNEIVVESSSEGQRYKSNVVKKMQNSLHISCRNLDWDEDEIYIINIGLETNPEVLFGVSITLTTKGSVPVAIKNILIKQSSDVTALDNDSEKEISLNRENENEEEQAIIKYFKQGNSSKLLFAEYGMTLEEFIDLNL